MDDGIRKIIEQIGSSCFHGGAVADVLCALDRRLAALESAAAPVTVDIPASFPTSFNAGDAWAAAVRNPDPIQPSTVFGQGKPAVDWDCATCRFRALGVLNDPRYIKCPRCGADMTASNPNCPTRSADTIAREIADALDVIVWSVTGDNGGHGKLVKDLYNAYREARETERKAAKKREGK
jgi:hypothetical protein